jgi:hypothetical protein
VFENKFAFVSSVYLIIGHEKVLLACLSKHGSEFTQVLRPCQPSSDALLNVNHLCPTLIEVDFHEVARAVATVQTLYQYAGAIAFEDSP